MKDNNEFIRLPLLLIGLFLVFAISCDKEDSNNGQDSYTDPRDGKVYQTVSIGNQVWMAENLAYAPSTGSYWAYDNDAAKVETYGYLYDWETACDVCPDGWHLPSDEEWTELIDYLGGIEVAGGKLKETGTMHWYAPNEGATNETGFTALPGGSRYLDGTFHLIGGFGLWWGASEYSAHHAGCLYISYREKDVDRGSYGKEDSFSVRCLRD